MPNNTKGMWDEKIAQIKIGGINGIAFINGREFGNSDLFVTEILREVDELKEEVFMVFAKKGNEGQDRLLKISKGESVYVTFDVFSE